MARGVGGGGIQVPAIYLEQVELPGLLLRPLCLARARMEWGVRRHIGKEIGVIFFFFFFFFPFFWA